MMNSLLKIYAGGEPLDLFQDTEIPMEYKNMMFSPGDLPEPYSLPFEIPNTPRNLRIFSNPHRITSRGAYMEIEAHVRFNGIKIISGMMMVLESGPERTRVALVGASMPITKTLPLNQIEMARYDLGAGDIDLPTGPVGDFSTATLGGRYMQLITDAITNTDGYPARNFTAAPVRIVDPFPLDTRGSHQTGSQYRSWYKNDGTGPLFYYKGFWGYQNTPATFVPVYPSVFVGHIMDSIFPGILGNNIFASGELARLCVPTLSHTKIDKMKQNRMLLDTIDTPVSDNHYFRLNSFMPNYKANDFVKSLLQCFGHGLYPVGLTSLRLVSYDDILSGIGVDDWNKKVLSYRHKPEKAMTFRYGYTDQGQKITDEISLEKDSMQKLQEIVISEADADSVTKVVRIPTTGQIFRVMLNQYSSSDSFADIVDSYTNGYDLAQDGLSSVEIAEVSKVFNMLSGIRALPSVVDPYGCFLSTPTGGVATWMTRFRECPLCDPGSGLDYTPSLVFWRGIKQAFGSFVLDYHTDPVLSSYNYDAAGVRQGDISLAWEGSDGLLARYHAAHKAWKESDHTRFVGEILLNEKDLSSLDLTRQKNAVGRNFIVDTIRVTLRSNRISPATVEMVSV